MENQINLAKQALYTFMQRMLQWETFYSELFTQEGRDFEKDKTDARNALADIYSVFVSARERKTGRLNCIHAGYPAEFDPSHETIIATEMPRANKIIFTTRWIHPDLEDWTEDHRFTMIKTHDEWQLDKKEAYSSFKNKWLSQPL